MIRLQVLPQDTIGECPFYMVSTDGRRRCFVKHTVSLTTAQAVLADNPAQESYNEAQWHEDCGGAWDTCSFIPLLYLPDYDAGEESDEPHAAPQAMAQKPRTASIEQDPSALAAPSAYEMVVKQAANTVDDPVAAIGKPDDSLARAVLAAAEAYQKVANPDENEAPTKAVEEADNEGWVEGEEPRFPINILIRRANPYGVNADVLVYPTNMLGIVDDERFMDETGGEVQRKCQELLPKMLKMGEIYPMPAGDILGIKPQFVYHAAVASRTRLVSPIAIRSATIKALQVADQQGAKNIALIPFDCGTHDIADVALQMMEATYQYATTAQITSLQNVGFVMTDKKSERIFQEYYHRIF